MAVPPANDHYIGMKDTHMIDRMSHDQLWDQVIRREPGDFLYAVTTMGIYCRPGCPSPRPLRKNVRFFRTVDEAEPAGFRACKRCDPKGERARLAEAVVQDACASIEAAEDIPSLDTLAARSGYSRFHFLRMFRDHTGLTPRSYAEGVRARRLHTALAGGARVADAVAECRLWLGKPRLREDRRATRHDARRGASRRRGRGHPHRLRRLPVRPPAGRRDRQGRLLHRVSPNRTRHCWAICANASRARGSLPTMRRWLVAVSRRAWLPGGTETGRSTCRSTCAAPRSSNVCGSRCAASRPARREAMARSPA